MLIAFLTHHKCGSSALYDYVAELARLNGLSLFASHVGGGELDTRYDLGFLGNAEYGQVRAAPGPQCVHLIRNPLNIVLSAYYSHRNTHPVASWPELARQREALLNMSVEEGLMSTAEFCNRPQFYGGTSGPLHAMNRWNYDDTSITTARVEDCFDRFTDSIRALFPLTPLRVWPDQKDFAFRRYSGGRASGAVDDHSHYRSGRSEAWRDELPRSVSEYVRGVCREVLERFYPDSL